MGKYGCRNCYGETVVGWRGMLFLVIAFLIFGVVLGMAINYSNTTTPLGQAICEEEYGMDFEKHNLKDGLVCKSRVKTQTYDGLKIKLIE